MKCDLKIGGITKIYFEPIIKTSVELKKIKKKEADEFHKFLKSMKPVLWYYDKDKKMYIEQKK